MVFQIPYGRGDSNHQVELCFLPGTHAFDGRLIHQDLNLARSVVEAHGRELKVRLAEPIATRSSSREVRARVPFFCFVYFSRVEPSQPKKKGWVILFFCSLV